MKRFSFSLQAVHDHRTVRREAAERELGEAADALAGARAALQTAVDGCEAAIAAYMDVLNSGSADPQEIALRANHITLLQKREIDRRGRVVALERAHQAKRDAVIAMSRDEKATGNLRDRHLARHQSAVQQFEQAALDEMANLAFGRRLES
jgi:flagellar export protein FliJ